MVIFWMSSLRTLRRDRTTQTRVKNARVYQNTLLLTGFVQVSLTLHSNLQCYSPCSSKSTHHLRPTRSLPAKFLVIQKSTAAKMTTISVFVSELMKKPNSRNTATMMALRSTKTRARQGCDDFLILGRMPDAQEATLWLSSTTRSGMSFWGIGCINFKNIIVWYIILF